MLFKGGEMMNNIAIKIEGLEKEYRLGSIGGKTLSQELQSWWAKVRKKDDPNSKIGQTVALNNTIFKAINGIDVEIKKGAKVGIIGTNGAGKSTLLKLISRVTAPTKGTIRINGTIASMLEVGTGFHPELTGRENIYLNGAILGMSKKEVDSKIADIIEFSEIGKFIDTPVKRYSSGMYVRLAFAVAAHLDPDILIVDEVLAVGDYQFQQKCLGKMDDISKGGRTVLFVSHQLSMIKQLCDECILMDKGKIVEYGEVNAVVKKYMEMRTVENTCVQQEYEWNDELDSAQVLSLSIVDKDGNPREEFDVFEELYLKARYVIKKKLTGVSIGFLLYGNSGATIHSFDTDLNRRLLEGREEGEFEQIVALPNILKAGSYSLDFTICRLGLTGIDFKPKALSFCVSEKNIDTSMSAFSSGRQGQFAFQVDWNNVKKVEVNR